MLIARMLGSYGMEILVNFAFYLPFLALLFFFAYRHNKRAGTDVLPIHIVGCFVYALYIAAVLNITGTSTLQDILMQGIKPQGPVGLIPFQNTTVFGFVGNIVLFLPLGLLTPWIFKRHTKLLSALALGFCFSLVIELSQLFNLRTTDVDDLIANTMGALVGFGIYRLFNRKRTSRLSVRERNVYLRYEHIIIIAAVFILRFSLMPIIYKYSI